jgi:type IV secretory pathway component VirB8
MSVVKRLHAGAWPVEPLSPEAAKAHIADAAARADEIRRTGRAYRRMGLVAGAVGAVVGVLGMGTAAWTLTHVEPTRQHFAVIEPETGRVLETLAAEDAPTRFTDDTARQYLRRFIETCDGYQPTLDPSSLERQFQRCAVLLTEPLQRNYQQYFSRSNLESPQLLLGRLGVRTPENLRYFKYPEQGRTLVWRVTYTRVETTQTASGAGTTRRVPMTAMVWFRWRPEAKMSLEDRTWNTAGMQVESFTIEPDTGR